MELKEDFILNSTMLDIIFIVFFLIMAIFGYIKGFITRLYDFISTIVVLFLSYWLAKPLSHIFHLYQYDQGDIIASMVGSIINQIFVFFVLLIVLFIVKKVLGFVIKPLLKTISDKFALTSIVDHTLGLVLSLVEAVIISYIAVVFLITPIYPSGKDMINQSLIAKHILNIIPSVSQKIENVNMNFESFFDSNQSVESLTKFMLTVYDLGLVDEEQVLTILSDNIANEKISLTTDNFEKLKDIFNKSNYSQEDMKSILSKINVSDE